VHFGIFNVTQRGHRSKPSRRVLAETANQAQVTEDLGFSTSWYPEQHFSNYSLCRSATWRLARPTWSR